MPIILTIWEAEPGGLQVCGQPAQYAKIPSNANTNTYVQTKNPNWLNIEKYV